MGWYTAVQRAVEKLTFSDDRYTRMADFHAVERLFGVRFNLDVCARNIEAAKCERFFSPAPAHGSAGVDGLAQSWAGAFGWDNPPYSALETWLLKHWREDAAKLSVMYCPSDRHDRPWWRKYVEPFIRGSKFYDPVNAAREHGFNLHGLDFTATHLRGRANFDLPSGVSAGNSPTWGIVVLGWDRR